MAVPKQVVWECKPHTLAKHRILERYLQAWYPILIGKSWCQTLTYAEGFAGPGVYEDGSPGSPVIAAEVFLRRKHLAVGKPLNMVLVEAHAGRLARLKQEMAVLVAKYGNEPGPLNAPRYEEGECGDKLLGALAGCGAWRGPVFAFLDSYGGPDVPLDVARVIARRRSSEVLITFGTNFLTRFGSKDEHQASGDQAFGGQAWRKVYELPAAEKKPFLISTYRDSLKTAGFTYVLSFEMIDDTGSDLHLVFGTKDPLGLERMKDAMWKVDPVRGVHYRDPRVPDQAAFEFDLHPDLEPLSLEILRILGDGERTVAQLQDHALLETVYRPPHARSAIIAMLKHGLVERQPSTGQVTRATRVRATRDGRQRLADWSRLKGQTTTSGGRGSNGQTGPTNQDSLTLF
jgi:three-Cys-motif partner protein